MENRVNLHAPPAPPARYVALAGPTASGKTAAAMAIARHHAVEIVSVDSALVYRGMDIGTAKPTRAERDAVAHHLIDIRDPLNAYSAAEFVRDAQALICDIATRGKLPLLVGGTMLYFKALFQGLDAMPAANAAIRAEIEAQAAREGWPAMHRRLADVDPITAARLQPADSQRIQRALEVFRVSGQPLSRFHTVKPQSAQPEAATLVSLEPTDRAWLHDRIAQRFEAMLTEGFLDEVRALRARGDLHPDLPSMRCVGYRQAWETLDGIATMQTLRDRGVFATRQLAKRQITWLRAMPQRRVVPCESADAIEQVLDHVAAHLRQGHAESSA
jgi:tRNA dimethylallyltransferase